MKLVDLHTHSTASDGTDSPAGLVKKAAAAGLAAVALTDHDTIQGLDEAGQAAREAGIEFIRGCELSTSTDQGSMHILGLWLPQDCASLEGFLDTLQQDRSRRNRAILEKLDRLGIKISMEELEAKAKSSIGRPHFAALMQEKGYVKSADEAFREFLGINGKAYVPKLSPRPEQAIRLLAGLGATPVLAHPLLRPRPAGWLEDLVRNLGRIGLDGLEAWHTTQNDADSSRIIALAEKYGLGLSGGSDYHGENKPNIRLGVGMGNLAVPEEVLIKLKARRKAGGLPC